MEKSWACVKPPDHEDPHDFTWLGDIIGIDRQADPGEQPCWANHARGVCTKIFEHDGDHVAHGPSGVETFRWSKDGSREHPKELGDATKILIDLEKILGFDRLLPRDQFSPETVEALGRTLDREIQLRVVGPVDPTANADYDEGFTNGLRAARAIVSLMESSIDSRKVGIPDLSSAWMTKAGLMQALSDPSLPDDSPVVVLSESSDERLAVVHFDFVEPGVVALAAEAAGLGQAGIYLDPTDESVLSKYPKPLVEKFKASLEFDEKDPGYRVGVEES
jgi:hypothetical protein